MQHFTLFQKFVTHAWKINPFLDFANSRLPYHFFSRNWVRVWYLVGSGVGGSLQMCIMIQIAPIRRRTITWTKARTVHWRVHTSPHINVMINSFTTIKFSIKNRQPATTTRRLNVNCIMSMFLKVQAKLNYKYTFHDYSVTGEVYYLTDCLNRFTTTKHWGNAWYHCALRESIHLSGDFATQSVSNVEKFASSAWRVCIHDCTHGSHHRVGGDDLCWICDVNDLSSFGDLKHFRSPVDSPNKGPDTRTFHFCFGYLGQAVE